jgi:hypothetical protein
MGTLERESPFVCVTSMVERMFITSQMCNRVILLASKRALAYPAVEAERSKKAASASQLISPTDKGKPVARPGTQSLGFSLRSAQAAEEERHRLVKPELLLSGGFTMRPVPSFHLSFPHARALQIAIASGAVAGLAVLGACTDNGGKSITAPSGPRTATIGSGGFGQAKILKLCVSAGSPAGNYTFRNIALNRSFAQDSYNNALSGNGFWDGTYWNDPGDGGDGTTVANAGVNVDYIVTPGAGGCVTVLTRSVGNSAYMAKIPKPAGPCDPAVQSCGGINDSFAAANISYQSNSASAVYDHTDCSLDNGVLMPEHVNPTTGSPPVATVPWPQKGYDGSAPFTNYGCGTSNSITRGFANYEHGATITYVFTSPPTQSNGLIAPTNTSCSDYANGTAATLSQIDDGFQGSHINSTSPGVFFYYATLTKASSQTVGFVQSASPNPGSLPLYGVHQGQAYLYNASCNTVATLTVSADGTTASGGTALAAGTYFLGVKFDTFAAKGVSEPPSLRASGSLLATHHYEAWLGTAAGLLATTTAQIDTKSK